MSFVTGAKRMRPPLEQQSGSNAAYQHPSNEIALQQQLLKQRHSSNSSPMLSSPVFGVQGQAGPDPSQLHVHSQPQPIGVRSHRHACYFLKPDVDSHMFINTLVEKEQKQFKIGQMYSASDLCAGPSILSHIH